MNALDKLLPTPRLVEIDGVDLAAPPALVWEAVRHGNLADGPIARALFALRALPDRLAGVPPGPSEIRIDGLVSSPEHPGFQILVDEPPHELAVGAIGKVWHPQIPFVHVAGADAFAAFSEAGFVKVAWAIHVGWRGEGTRLEIEVRVDATDEASWGAFRSYFRVIGVGSRFIRHAALAALARRLGRPEDHEDDRPLPGDDLLPDGEAAITQAITIHATPEAIWPWLVQMGCGRAGFYSVDWLDDGGVPSARQIHPDLQRLAVGDVLPATPHGDDGFEVLRIDPARVLVLGGLYDVGAGKQLPFAAPRPARFWQVTWAFALEALDGATTRLHVRARAAFPPDQALHAAWIGPVHRFMEAAQLRHLAARAEGRLPRDDAGEVLAGIGGAGVMALALLTPFLRGPRNHWGLTEEQARRRLPGDDLVPEPRWMWTHGIEIDAPAGDVWPWVAQVGVGRGGFYSYQWLENLAGCGIENAEAIHPEWEVREGDPIRLHPSSPPLRVVDVSPGHGFVAFGAPDEAARAAGKPWAAGSWLFLIEPLDLHRCRFVSRFRSACSDDLASVLTYGRTLLEPIGFAMDRRMLLGVKERAERRAREKQ